MRVWMFVFFNIGLGLALIFRNTMVLHFSWFYLSGLSVFLFCLSCFFQWRVRSFCFFIALILMGYSCFSFHWQQLMQWHLSSDQIKKPLFVTGWIATIPHVTPMGSQFVFHAQTIQGKRIKTHFMLSWYKNAPILHLGQYWHFAVKLRPLHTFQNPGALNTLPYYWSQGVMASGYVDSQKRVWHGVISLPITGRIGQIRETLEQYIQHGIKEKSLSAVIVALCVGARNLMTPSQWQVFQNTGTSHLIAISGLHIGLVGMLIYGFVSRCWRQFPKCVYRVPAPRVGAIAALMAALIYSAMAGFAVPTQRACVMLTVLFLNVLFDLSLSLYWRIALAWTLVVAFDPFALWSASFWLSFLAVISIGGVMFRNEKSKNVMKQWWRLQLGIFIGLFPITLFYFQQVSLVMFPCNLIAIPWMSFVVVPLCLLACVITLFSTTLSTALFKLAAWSLWPLWQFLKWSSALPHVVWQHNIFHFSIFILLVMSVVLFFLPSGWPGRWLFWIGILPLFFYAYPRPTHGVVWLTVLDVGQGLASVLQTEHHTLVYDTGAKSPFGFDAGRQVVVPFLHYAGVCHLNTMMISHGDNDHIGGADSVMHVFPNAQVLTSVPSKLSAYHAQFCYAGQHWQWDGVDFAVLWPRKGAAYQDNNSSCVLRVTVGLHHLLLTGDLEQVVESQLLKQAKPQLPADLIVAPHHGSRTSSSWPFVRVVAPKMVIYPVGYLNRYRFPSSTVQARYKQIGAVSWRTDTQGAGQWEMSVNGIKKYSG